MATKFAIGTGSSSGNHTNKKTSQGRKNVKFSTMNKSQKRGYKKYRGQG